MGKIPPNMAHGDDKHISALISQEAYPSIHSKINDIQPAYDVSKLLSLDEKRQRARKARIYCEGEVAKHGAGQQMCPYPCGIVCMKVSAFKEFAKQN